MSRVTNPSFYNLEWDGRNYGTIGVRSISEDSKNVCSSLHTRNLTVVKHVLEMFRGNCQINYAYCGEGYTQLCILEIKEQLAEHLRYPVGYTRALAKRIAEEVWHDEVLYEETQRLAKKMQATLRASHLE